MSNSSYIRRVGLSITLLAALGLAACKSDSGAKVDDVVAQTVVVVGVDTTESHVLTEVYAQALEKAGFRVARRDDVADLAAGYAALQSGAADLFLTHTAELLAYAGEKEPAADSTSTTALPTTSEAPTTTIDTNTTAIPTSTVVETTVIGPVAPTTSIDESETTLPEETTTTTISIVGEAAAISINGQTSLIGEILPDNLQIGAASDAENKGVIACNAGVAATNNLSTLADLAEVSEDLTIAGPASFETDTPFGLPGFEDAYGGTFKEFTVAEPADLGEQITSPTTTTTVAADTTVLDTAETTTTEVGATTTTVAPLPSEVDCAAFNSLDPSIPVDAVVMDDNLNWITTNGVIPLVSTTGYTPGVSQLLDQVSQALRTADVRAMIGEVENNGTAPGAIASRYITAAGLAGG